MYKTLCFYFREFLECVLLLFCRLRPGYRRVTTVIYEVDYSNIYLVYLEATWLAVSAIQNVYLST